MSRIHLITFFCLQVNAGPPEVNDCGRNSEACKQTYKPYSNSSSSSSSSSSAYSYCVRWDRPSSSCDPHLSVSDYKACIKSTCGKWSQ